MAARPIDPPVFMLRGISRWAERSAGPISITLFAAIGVGKTRAMVLYPGANRGPISSGTCFGWKIGVLGRHAFGEPTEGAGRNLVVRQVTSSRAKRHSFALPGRRLRFTSASDLSSGFGATGPLISEPRIRVHRDRRACIALAGSNAEAQRQQAIRRRGAEQLRDSRREGDSIDEPARLGRQASESLARSSMRPSVFRSFIPCDHAAEASDAVSQRRRLNVFHPYCRLAIQLG